MTTRSRSAIRFVVMATTTATLVSCSPFGSTSSSAPPPTTTNSDGGVANGDDAASTTPPKADGGGQDDAGPSSCQPVTCPAKSFVCDGFDGSSIDSAWFKEGTGITVPTLVPDCACAGNALSMLVSARTGATERSRLSRSFVTTAREFFVDFDLWLDIKTSEFVDPAFGNIFGLGARSSSSPYNHGLFGIALSKSSGPSAAIREVDQDDTEGFALPPKTWVHLTLHVLFDDPNGLFELDVNGNRLYTKNQRTLNGAFDHFELVLGLLTAEGSTPGGSAKIDNFVLR